MLIIWKNKERKWQPYELAEYAKIHCLKTWKRLFLVTFVEIQTDHKPLTYFWSQSKVTGKIARWLDLLSVFNLKLDISSGAEGAAGSFIKETWIYEDLEALYAIFAAHGCTLDMKFSLIPSDCPNRGESMTKIQEDSNMWAGDTFLEQLMTQVNFDETWRGESLWAYIQKMYFK